MCYLKLWFTLRLGVFVPFGPLGQRYRDYTDLIRCYMEGRHALDVIFQA